jgi:hypothetical protein
MCMTHMYYQPLNGITSSVKANDLTCQIFIVPILCKGHTQCDSVLSVFIFMTKSSCHQAIHMPPNVEANSILQIFWYQIGCILSKNGILHILVHSHMFCIYSETMQCSNDYHKVTLVREIWILNWKMQSWVTLTSGSKWILDLLWIWHNYWTLQTYALPIHLFATLYGGMEIALSKGMNVNCYLD